jgi:lactobin A/cerein 7B family class IIb bacteriocin
MNLDNLNLVELNAQEVQEVEGGWIAVVLVIALLLYSQSAH